MGNILKDKNIVSKILTELSKVSLIPDKDFWLVGQSPTPYYL